MPEPSLRAYGRDIDELIERERLDQAIAHCRHILQTYPKHLETYRLLGKAYLEAKRYGDAADIFQRVLSAVPDDFVSHIGMAIVREDEGNLDAAIWHMERAFETNPSNPAIQQEMKRLISRRDGLEPHKVRLTRGALARMYAHGELYAQAIAELRSALQEDAERPDLQVLLASMYWHTNQRTEATSVSNQILEKLPYCQEANRILAANLQASDRVEEAAVYHRRLAGLNPYAAFVESALADPSTVEESAVTLEQLEWEPGEPLPTSTTDQPGWAATLGMEMQEPSEESAQEASAAQTGPLPSWLEPGEPPPFEASAEKELREELEIGDEDVVAELDSGESQFEDSYSEEGVVSELDSEESQPEDSYSDEGEPAEIAAEGIGAGAVAAAGVAAGMFAQRDDGDEQEPPVQEDEPEAETIADEDSVGEAAAAVVGEDDDVIADAPEDGAESEIPDWMQEAGWTESTGESVETPVSFSDADMDALDAGQLPPEQSEDGELAPAQLPDWIQDIPHDEAADIAGGAGDGDLPGWLADETADDEGVDLSADLEQPEAPVAQEAQDAPESGMGQDEETSYPTAESDGKELPTWITEDSPGATETIVTWLEDRDDPSLDVDSAEAEEIPDWMKDTGALDEPTGLVDEPAGAIPEEGAPAEPSKEPPEAEPAQDFADSVTDPGVEQGAGAPGWLAAVAAVAADDEAEQEEPLPSEEQETPDWLTAAMEGDSEAARMDVESAGFESELGEEPAAEPPPEPSEEPAAVPPPEREPTAEPSMAPPSEPELQEAELEEQVAEATSEVQDSGAPEWLQEIGTSPLEPVAAESAEWLEEVDEEELAPAQPVKETPDWLKGLADEGADAEARDSTGTADWLREIAEPGSVADSGSVDADATPEAEEAQAPDWLEGVAEESQEPAAAAGAPDWLRGMDEGESKPPSVEEQVPEVVSEEPAPEPTAPVVEEDDEVMEWLEDLAAKQDEPPSEADLAAAATVEPAVPVMEERTFPEEPEEGLEWLESLADQRGLDVDVDLPQSEAQPAPGAQRAEPEEEPEVERAPDWLNTMATQPLPPLDSEVSPDAETVEAQAEEVEAQMEEILDEREAETPFEVSPTDVTIEARASDLEQVLEAEQEAPDETDEDEIPDWLVAAAAQGDVTPDATTVPGLEIAAQAAEIEELPSSPSEGDEASPPDLDEAPPVEADAAAEAEAVEPSEALYDVFDEFEAAVEPQVEEVEAEEPTYTPEADVPEQVAVAREPTDQVETVGEVEAEDYVEAPEEIAAIGEPTDQVEAVSEVEAEEYVETHEEVAAAGEPTDQVDALVERAPEPIEPEPEQMEEPKIVEKPGPEDPTQVLERARQALAAGDTEEAAEQYSGLVKRKEALASTVEDLRIALDRNPNNPVLWQVLGDAYMRNDQTDEAIEAFRKGMEAA